MQVLCYVKKMDTCGGLNGTKFVVISLIRFSLRIDKWYMSTISPFIHVMWLRPFYNWNAQRKNMCMCTIKQEYSYLFKRRYLILSGMMYFWNNDFYIGLLNCSMGESFQYFDRFQFFGKGPDSSWDLCKFDKLFSGGEVRIFYKEIKNFERILNSWSV